jgi:hypothetical protein
LDCGHGVDVGATERRLSPEVMNMVYVAHLGHRLTVKVHDPRLEVLYPGSAEGDS